MNYSIPRQAVYAFFVTALIYLTSLTFISYPLTTLLKPIPIICLIMGVAQSSCSRWAKTLIIIALSFSMLGDIVLTLPIQLTLEFGIGSFFWAHCCYSGLLLKSFEYNRAHVFYFAFIFALMSFFAFILMPYLGVFLVPVLVYFCVLMLMVFSALNVSEQRGMLALGALTFLLSDLVLAFNLFVYPQADGRFVIMLAYYSAQLLLTVGLVGLYKKASDFESDFAGAPA